MPEPGATLDLSGRTRVHLVGVAGAGMSAIAEVLLAMGHTVSGSDAAGGKALERLRDLGADVRVGHDPAAVEGVDVVAVSTAVPPTDPEVAAAVQRGITVARRSEILAGICRQKRTIGVSGTHGKTSTAAMLSILLRHAGLSPSLIVGGDIVGLGNGAVWDPAGEWMVVEADESDGTFLELGCEAVVVTSVGPDHLDYFGTFDGVEAAFRRFVSEAPGPAVLCADDAGAAALAPVIPPDRSMTYGVAPLARYQVSGVSLRRFGAQFVLSDARQELEGRCEIAVPGMHNVLNATAAVVAAVSIGVEWGDALQGIAAYRGVGRRFELRGERAGVTFVDDYAHNPEKVAAALQAARDGGWERIVAVFQPHRYTRTQALWRQFGPALAGADVLIVTDIYAAGEQPIPGISGELIAEAVKEASPRSDVRYEPSLDDAERVLSELLRPGDLCLTLGAGDVTVLPARLIGDGDRSVGG